MANNEYKRRSCRSATVGTVKIGGGAPLSVQTMTNTDTRDTDATINQIKSLYSAGADIIRLAVPDNEAAEAFGRIKKALPDAPLVADIHFDYRLAIICAELGADKIRINPGNIGGEDNVRKVADACRRRGIPIRIGVNGGSAEKSIVEKYGGVCAEALAESALYHARLLENCNFEDIIIAVKASDVPTTIKANRILAESCPYPLHIGVTEAGGEYSGIIKSAAGIGTLLSEGIGDTIRISLTAAPEKEVRAGIELLRALSLRSGPDIIACPTCGRTKIDLIGIYDEFCRRAPAEIPGFSSLDISIAIMGCIVNGPGEASRADIGLAGGSGRAAIFSQGKTLMTVEQEKAVDALIDEIKRRYPAK
ncbi:MAG: flavodoxin-dependent (E)-4-hydroxy-3-methylbut-2-enyl-diphosphate synthase [Eubacteriales bacterium]|jgi:(E)-4-hydroxy-3-methylbut-2-enyl-diphosphate synthase